jgi:hypothetical protein
MQLPIQLQPSVGTRKLASTWCGWFAALLLTTASLAVAKEPTPANQEESAMPIMRVGMIGLDTSHAIAFTKLMNDPAATGALAKMDVVAAFPGGSPDLASSRDRVGDYTKQMKDMGVTIVESIDQLLTQVDAVLLESVDGRPHLQQAIPVFRSGKPVFIDKPLAGTLADAVAIDLAAKHFHSRWFSSSSLRFSPSIWKSKSLREEGKLVGAISWGPAPTDPTHPDLFWYGIHGVETLFTAMGEEIETVSRTKSDGTDTVTGLWKGGKVGTFRGIRDGKSDYGLMTFGTDAIDSSAKYEGYGPLVQAIGDFFAGGPAPVAPSETVAMFYFMEAAHESTRQGGKPVEIESLKRTTEEQAKKRLKELGVDL